LAVRAVERTSAGGASRRVQRLKTHLQFPGKELLATVGPALKALFETLDPAFELLDGLPAALLAEVELPADRLLDLGSNLFAFGLIGGAEVGPHGPVDLQLEALLLDAEQAEFFIPLQLAHQPQDAGHDFAHPPPEPALIDSLQNAQILRLLGEVPFEKLAHPGPIHVTQPIEEGRLVAVVGA